MKTNAMVSVVLIAKDKYDLMLLCNTLKSEIISYNIIPFYNIDDAIMYLDYSESSGPDIIIISSDILSSWEKMLAAIFQKDNKLKNTALKILTHSKEEKVKFAHLKLPAESFIPRAEMYRKSYYEIIPDWSSLTNLRDRYN